MSEEKKKRGGLKREGGGKKGQRISDFVWQEKSSLGQRTHKGDRQKRFLKTASQNQEKNSVVAGSVKRGRGKGQ